MVSTVLLNPLHAALAGIEVLRPLLPPALRTWVLDPHNYTDELHVLVPWLAGAQT
jgi:hypothetical protein